jgi:hypothetical protein
MKGRRVGKIAERRLKTVQGRDRFCPRDAHVGTARLLTSVRVAQSRDARLCPPYGSTEVVE